MFSMHFYSTAEREREGTSVMPPVRSPENTHARWGVMCLLALIFALTYLGRLNFSIAGKFIQDEYGFSTETMGWMLSAFVLGYALFQIPGGWLADRLGSRSVLTGSIVWWSVFTACMGLAPHIPWLSGLSIGWSFAIMRFLVGIGEAPASPASNRIVAAWMGLHKRGVGSSFGFIGIGVGGIGTPLLITWVMQNWGWEGAFYVSALLGGVVALLWHWAVTDRPEDHPGVGEQELALIQRGAAQSSAPKRPTPWRSFIRNRNVWGLCLSYFCQGYPIYIFHTWFFLYLIQVRGFSLVRSGIWDGAPYLAIALLSPLGGYMSDWAVARFGRTRGRRYGIWVGMISSAALLWLGANSKSNVAAVTLLSLAAGANMFAAATWWAASIDLAPDHSGSLAGLMNTFGNLGGWLAPALTAYLAAHWGWTAALDFAACVSLAGAAIWLLIRVDHPVDALTEPCSHPAE